MPPQPTKEENLSPSQPGQVIVPGGVDQAVPEPPAAAVAAPQPISEQTAYVPPVALPQAPQSSEAAYTQALDEDSVTWQATEFIAHDKSAGWFLGLAVFAIILAATVYIVSKDIVSTVVIIVAAAIFGFYANHKPREMTYQLDRQGITIGHRQYSYDEFKSFSIKPEGPLLSLTFMPLKRFAPSLTIYYAVEQEESIIKVLTARMPYEDPRRDTVDSLMKKIRF